VTTCPVTNTITSGGSEITQVTSTLSTVTLTSTSTICTECEGTGIPIPTGQSPVTSSTPGSQQPPPPGPAPCPGVVPRCMNTWLHKVPNCKSNSDVSCFCPSSEFTSSVIDCIQAWGSSDAEIQSALSYFTGICAAQVPENPGIITYIPTTITLAPTQPPIPTPTGSNPAPITYPPTGPPESVPCTTITVSHVTTGADSQTSLYETTVTVPQVGFSTGTGVQPTSGSSVDLVPGNPEAIPTPGSGNNAGSSSYAPFSPIKASSTFATYSSSETVPQVVRFTGAASPSLSMSSGSWLGAAFAIVFGLL
jgi:hypothetical protein